MGNNNSKTNDEKLKFKHPKSIYEKCFFCLDENNVKSEFFLLF